jgi:chromosome partitioning protein
MEAITNSLGLVKTTQTPVFVVMNAIAPQGHEGDEAAEAIAALDVEVCPTRVVNRVAFSRSLITGKTAQEFEPESKAAQEIEQLHIFMCEQLQTCTNEQAGVPQHVEQIRRRA